MKLQKFNQVDFLPALRAFFNDLNVPINYVADEPTTVKELLKDTYKENESFLLADDVYFVGMVDDAAFSGSSSIETKMIKSDYDGILIFGITLKNRTNGFLPKRSQLAEITRAFNREFYYTPVVVVFKYGEYLAFANAERLKFKQEWREGEKAGKVSLLRDICIESPHSGHERILNELEIPTTGKNKVDSFTKLYAYWQQVFSVNVLNKKFYQELSNWYFWAIQHVTFPGEPKFEDAHRKKVNIEDLIQEHRATNVIRMLTRLLFVWFIKEKKLVPEELFDLEALQGDILNDISPYNEVGLFVERNRESIYYKAILQNLFFATLNCPIEPDSLDKRVRGFRGEGYGTHRGIDYLMRYKQYFKNPDVFLEKMNAVVPFLNGGLFECLDDKFNNTYIDGFSDNMTKGEQLIVPDYLFFGLEEEADISDVIGIKDKKHKNAAVKGLINILKSYKFTITENTPIEEDVALDPELLGKVFENLLASYNPETKKTARKQTGSFFTPREIVNYMVDESLIAFLKNAINDWGPLDDETLDKELHILTSFDNVVPFSDNFELHKKIITALSSCTILDPACGSGAFPMGALQKMVHILHKLDPENKIWKNIQLGKAENESRAAFKIEDKIAREERLLEINEAFDQSINDPDYARKLFLIENCIFGVDIQPIATQISKLRFFISLVVEQKVNPDKKNFGIRPLPNLETKFVAANTLIGIERPSSQLSLYDTKIIKELEEKLKMVRSKLFSAKSKETKLKYRDEDNSLRTQIAEELENSGWKSDTAQKLAGWDPYDQNLSSTFFDSEWMFDIKNGFDIIIGNPPWGADLSVELKKNLKENLPEIDSSTPNSFAYFIGVGLINSNGILSYVLPDSILIKDYAKTRKLIRNNVFEISWYLNTGIPEYKRPFVYVEHDVCVLFVNNNKITDHCNINKYHFDNNTMKSSKETYLMKKDDFIKPEHDFSFNLRMRTAEINLYSQLFSLNRLSDILQCHEGIHTGNSRELLFHNRKINSTCKPLFYGSKVGDLIKNYCSKPSGWFVDYRHQLIDKSKGYYASLRDEKIFKLPKIFITRTGNPLIAFYDDNNYASNNFFSLQFKQYNQNNENSLKTILPLILSKFSNYYIRVFAAPRLGDTFIETKIFHILRIPYPQILIGNMTVMLICDLIIFQIEKDEDYSILQCVMDSIIFNLYFPDHMKERGIDILQFVEYDLNDVLQQKIFAELAEEEKVRAIESLNIKWSSPDNEVVKRIGKFKERSPEILKVILNEK